MARWPTLRLPLPRFSVRERAGSGASPHREPGRYPDTVLVRVPGMGDRPPSGFRMHVRDGSDQIARELFRTGWHGFERPVPDVFARCVAATDGLVLDVGANTGFYALVAACASPTTAVHAFEPYPPALTCLEENLTLNRALAARIDVFPTAVGDETGEARLYVPDPAHGLVETSCSLNGSFKERVVGDIGVKVVTVDAHVEALGRPAVGVVKIDVESLEHKVLAGASTLLDRDRPLVFLEVLPSGEPDAIDGIRQRHGYVAVRLRAASAVVGGPVAFDAEGWNQALVPEEKVEAVEGVLDDLSLPMLRDGAGA